jgi:hypothetical protein
MNKNFFQPTIINVKCPLTCSVPQNSMFGLPRLVEGKLMAAKKFQENMYLWFSHMLKDTWHLLEWVWENFLKTGLKKIYVILKLLLD